MNLTKQQQKVFTYIENHRGCTTKDIMLDTGITCPSARITELRAARANIISVGKKHYAGSKPFEMYAIGYPAFFPSEDAQLPTATTLQLVA
jgi:hypothetical protein